MGRTAKVGSGGVHPIFTAEEIMSPRQHKLMILLVSLHMAALLAYTLPTPWVPARVRIWASSYVRPIFHQNWQLFAPDPPLCSCDVQVLIGDQRRSLHTDHEGYLTRRMAQTIARQVQVEVAQGDTVPHPYLVQAMHAMVRDVIRDGGSLRFQLAEHCVVDPQKPSERVVRVTPLQTATP